MQVAPVQVAPVQVAPEFPAAGRLAPRLPTSPPRSGDGHGRPAAPPRITIGPVGVDDVTEQQALSRVLEALGQGKGGLLVTPNLFILRCCATTVTPQLVNDASLILVDGAPLVWVARLQRTPVAARIPGATFMWTLCAAAERTGHSVFLLGGLPGAAEGASDVLLRRFPRLRLVGHECPPMGFEDDPEQMAALTRRLVDEGPDMVFVALGFPKQERVSTVLAESLPGTWFFCCGASLDFAAGMKKRAPVWMQRAGLEWAFRAMTEPRRLGPRYLRDAVYGLRLFWQAWKQRVERRPGPAAGTGGGSLHRSGTPLSSRRRRSGSNAVGGS